MTVEDETKALHGEQPTVSQHNYSNTKPNWCDILNPLPQKYGHANFQCRIKMSKILAFHGC